jgi:uncharacterized repeat protein (TIGR03806 family)
MLGFMALLLFSCSELPETESLFFAEDNPVKLSSWRLLHQDGTRLRVADNAEIYYLASGLFSDYALKLRTVSIPEVSRVPVTDTGEMQFPVGTVISKTFYYVRAESQALPPAGALRVAGFAARAAEVELTLNLDRVVLLETRLLVRRSDGWHALPYVWDADQQDATLKIAGAMLPVSLHKNDQVRSFAYVVPNQNQCAGCHTLDHGSKRIEPIGPQAKHLNRLFPGSADNQLSKWRARGWLAEADYETALRVPKTANWEDEGVALEQRARSYLDINCGHCHSKTGPADTSGLFLDASVMDPLRWGRCKTPVAAGQGTGGNLFSVVPGAPDESILVYRMVSLEPGAMMPELGRGLVHDEGVDLIRDWIQALPGKCDTIASMNMVQAH